MTSSEVAAVDASTTNESGRALPDSIVYLSLDLGDGCLADERTTANAILRSVPGLDTADAFGHRLCERVDLVTWNVEPVGADARLAGIQELER